MRRMQRPGLVLPTLAILCAALAGPSHAAAGEAARPAASPLLESLSNSLSSDDPFVRLDAVKDLARLGPDALPVLHRAFKDPDESVRAAAVGGYIGIAGQDALPLLEPLVNDRSTRVHHEILNALRQWNTPSSIALFLRILKEGPEQFHPFAISLLEGVEDPQVTPVMLDLARSGSSALVRRGAFYVLAYQKNAAAVDLVRDILKGDSDFLVQEAAVHYSAALGCERARPLLVPALALSKVQVRQAATDKLANTCGEHAVDDLVTTLSWTGEKGQPPPPTPSMKTKILGLLARHPAPSARPLIVPLLSDEEPMVRRGAVRALGAIGGEDLGELIAPLAGDEDRSVRDIVLDRLAVCRAELAAPILTRALESDTSLQVRLTAARSLGRLGSSAGAGVSALTAVLESDSPELRVEAATALAAIGDPTAVPSLVSRARDDVRLVRSTVAEALGTLGDARAIEALQVSAVDSEPSVRLAAVRALGRIGDGRARKTLEQAARDPDPQVRSAARDALKVLPESPKTRS